MANDDLDTALDEVFGFATESPEEAEPEEQPEEAAEEQEAPAQEEAPTEEAPEEPEPPALLAGKYTSTEELERAYLEAQSKLGEQGNELGALRKEFQELRESLQKPEQPEFTGPPVADVPEWFDGEVLEDYDKGRAGMLWIAQHEPYAYEAALDQWFEANPRAASAYEREIEIAQLREEFQADVEPVKASHEEVTAQQQAAKDQEAAQATFNKAWSAVAGQVPDLEEMAQAIVEEAKLAPALAEVIQHNDVEQTQNVLAILYRSAKARQAEAEAAASAQVKATADAARSQAKVITATSSRGSSAPGKASLNDKILELFDREAGFITD